MALRIDWTYSGITPGMVTRYTKGVSPEVERMRHAASVLYDDDRASINLSLDMHHVEIAEEQARRLKGTTLLVVIGIGGSNLGTMAVADAILGRQHNLLAGKRPRVLWLDTVDPLQTSRIAQLVQAELRRKGRVVLNAVSKSGGTTETVANLEILLDILKREDKRWKEHVVITTDEGSALWHLAHEQGFAALPIPKKVGGRYSVLSPVGLFPLALLGIDIRALMDGAAHMRARCLKHDDNPAIARAAFLAHARTSGRRIADTFAFATDLESVGRWYRQLMGESIGKEWNHDHTERVHEGMTPTVSIGSTDLHSMAQLYFGGPDDKAFTLLKVDAWGAKVKVPRMKEYDVLVPNIQGKDLSAIMDAIAESVVAVLASQGRPTCVITLPQLDEESIGELLQLHMLEMMYLGASLNVNPFDQPNVEEYKVGTKKRLARGGR